MDMAEFTSKKLLFNQEDFKDFLKKRLEEAQQAVWQQKEIADANLADSMFEKFNLKIPVFEIDKISTPPEHTLRVPTFPEEENAPKSSLKMRVDVPFSGDSEFFHVRLSIRSNEFAIQHGSPREYPLPDGQVIKDSLVTKSNLLAKGNLMFSIKVYAGRDLKKIEEDKKEAIKYILDELEIYLNWHREKLREENFSDNLKQVIEREIENRRGSK